jgi:hypothetical protein
MITRTRPISSPDGQNSSSLSMISKNHSSAPCQESILGSPSASFFCRLCKPVETLAFTFEICSVTCSQGFDLRQLRLEHLDACFERGVDPVDAALSLTRVPSSTCDPAPPSLSQVNARRQLSRRVREARDSGHLRGSRINNKCLSVYSAAMRTAGPAALTSASTCVSNARKLSWNMPTSFRAVWSNSNLLRQVLKG